MKKLILKEKMLITKSVVVTLASFLILLGVFNLLRVSNDYFCLVILLILLIMFIYQLILEKKLKK